MTQPNDKAVEKAYSILPPPPKTEKTAMEIALSIVTQVYGDNDSYHFTDEKHPLVPLIAQAIQSERQKVEQLKKWIVQHREGTLNGYCERCDYDDWKRAVDKLSSAEKRVADSDKEIERLKEYIRVLEANVRETPTESIEDLKSKLALAVTALQPFADTYDDCCCNTTGKIVVANREKMLHAYAQAKQTLTELEAK